MLQEELLLEEGALAVGEARRMKDEGHDVVNVGLGVAMGPHLAVENPFCVQGVVREDGLDRFDNLVSSSLVWAGLAVVITRGKQAGVDKEAKSAYASLLHVVDEKSPEGRGSCHRDGHQLPGSSPPLMSSPPLWCLLSAGLGVAPSSG